MNKNVAPTGCGPRRIKSVTLHAVLREYAPMMCGRRASSRVQLYGNVMGINLMTANFVSRMRKEDTEVHETIEDRSISVCCVNDRRANFESYAASYT
jgi:hypothetical protein